MAYYATYMPNELGELQKVVINAGVGFVLPYYGETAPPGTLACDGSEISRAAYGELFAVLGTKAGAGDGSTTFKLPDLRGQFVRGTGGNAAELGTEQGDAIRNISGYFGFYSYLSAWLPVVEATGAFAKGPITQLPSYTLSNGDEHNDRSVAVQLSIDNVVPTAAENRPTNTALLWCIIYE